MARRCGCASNFCNCQIAASTNGSLTVTGSGNASDPYVIDMGPSLATEVQAQLTALLGPDFELMAEFPRGALAYGEATEYHTAISTEESLAVDGLIVYDVPTLAGRRYRLTAACQVFHPAAGTQSQDVFYIKEGGVPVASDIDNTQALLTRNGTFFASAILTPGAGTHTWDCTLQTNVGLIDMIADPLGKAYLLVEDIGSA